MKTVNDIASEIAETNGLKKALVKGVVKQVFEFIEEAVKSDDTVRITGFGTFSLKKRGERMGRNPKTGEPAIIKASEIVGFKPSKSGKE